MPSLLIRQANFPDRDQPHDCLIRDGRIELLALSISESAEEEIDARGLTLLPGVIDIHVHFRFPGATHKEDWSSGSAAAIAGGVTTVLDMPNNEPPVTTKERLGEKIDTIRTQNPAVDFGCYIGATTDNLKEVMASQKMACGVKITPYLAGKRGAMLIDDEKALHDLFAASLPLTIVIHAESWKMIQEKRATVQTVAVTEHGTIHFREAALRALEGVFVAAQGTSARLHITHISTKEELAMIQQAKREGYDVTCDVTPHHLAFTDEDLKQHGGQFKVNPPLRTQQDCDALWNGVISGDIDMVASDHAPHLLSEKSGTDWDTVSSGIPGVQTLLPFLLDRLSEQFSLHRLVEVTATQPAKRFGLENKGHIAEGFLADLVLVDLTKETAVTRSSLQSKCGWSPWEGATFRGAIQYVIKSGRVMKTAIR